MIITAALAVTLRPSIKIADKGLPFNLDSTIPKQFGDWTVDEKVVTHLVNPQERAAVDKIYTQVLTRTYVNHQGYRIMLSIPYGTDQSDGLAAHDPEGCYPSQGFQILTTAKETLRTALGSIPVRRMEAESGSRHEPVTYWFTVGNQAVNDGWERKKAQMQYNLRGEIPDGMLVRASSIDRDTRNAYRHHDQFLRDLISALPTNARPRISGILH
jgi:EpsI family protein